MKAVIYARVSTKDKGQDTENQLPHLREYALKHGYTLTHEYIDHASAKSGDRSQFKALFADAAKRRFDVVLFWSLDRFSREGVRETLNYLNRLEASGVGFKSYTEQYLDSCGIFKDAVMSILATIAKQERIRISERTIAGLERAKAQGAILGRRPAVFDRQRVFDLHRSGASVREIAKALGAKPSTIQRAIGQMGPKLSGEVVDLSVEN